MGFLLALSPWLWLMPSPRLMPIPTTDTTVLATTVLATVLDTDTDTVSATTDTTARGPLMLSPPLSLRPRLMPIPTTDTTAMDMVLATPATDTVSATTARGPLRPSPPLMLMPRLIPTTDTTA